ncbi:MAG: SRPBCC domain-containing protein, partial [Arenibacterium sp.]
MKDLHEAEFIRDYNVSVARLWAAVTEPREIVQWFGPEGVELEDCSMDFSKLGAWTCTMRGLESGQRFKVSGVVTSVTPPMSGQSGAVGFTWGWHDD